MSITYILQLRRWCRILNRVGLGLFSHILVRRTVANKNRPSVGCTHNTAVRPVLLRNLDVSVRIEQTRNIIHITPFRSVRIPIAAAAERRLAADKFIFHIFIFFQRVTRFINDICRGYGCNNMVISEFSCNIYLKRRTAGMFCRIRQRRITIDLGNGYRNRRRWSRFVLC